MLQIMVKKVFIFLRQFFSLSKTYDFLLILPFDWLHCYYHLLQHLFIEKCIIKKKLFLHQNICCGCSKEPSHRDGSFENPKHMLHLMVKKVLSFLRSIIILYLELQILTHLCHLIGYIGTFFSAQIYQISYLRICCLNLYKK